MKISKILLHLETIIFEDFVFITLFKIYKYCIFFVVFFMKINENYDKLMVAIKHCKL